MSPWSINRSSDGESQFQYASEGIDDLDKSMSSLLDRLTRAGFDGKIVAVVPNDHGGLTIEVAADIADMPVGGRYAFDFSGVRETTVVVGDIEEIDVRNDHPVMWDYSERHENIYFSEAPSNPYEIIGRLFEAHKTVMHDWRPFSKYLSASSGVLTGGYGMLASGPVSLMKKYREATAEHLGTYSVFARDPTNQYQTVFFDDYYVIAATFTIKEVV